MVISGCSGGGKSTLLAELASRGFRTVEEPGRRVVHHQMKTNGSALPWIDLEAFATCAFELARTDLHEANSDEWTFFDRGMVDAAVAGAFAANQNFMVKADHLYQYHEVVFMTPPWPEIYAPDAERRHGFDSAVAEYERLMQAYPRLGYELIVLPKISVEERADFILQQLRLHAGNTLPRSNSITP